MSINYVPEIIDSSIAEDAIIDVLSHIIKSKIGKMSKIYKNCWILDSELGDKALVGDNTKIDHGVLKSFCRIGKNNHLYYVNMGKHSYTGQNTVAMRANIGNFCSISWNVTIGGANHDYNRVTSHAFLYNEFDSLNNGITYYNRFEEPCIIGNDVWIGANSCILRGVNIEDGAVIGAGAVVTKSVPAYAIVVGNPARIKKYRFDEKTIERLLKIKWWELSDALIRKYCDVFSFYPNRETLDILESLKDKDG